jgi:type VI secretion system secreted protein VgrG
VAGSRSVLVGGDLSDTVGKSRTVKIGKDLVVNVGASHEHTVGETYTLKAKKIVLSADDELTIKVGDATVVFKDGEVKVDGKKIQLKASGDIVLKAAKVVEN